jgi:alpha-tubulin suppressor-like RCC1 family protein
MRWIGVGIGLVVLSTVLISGPAGAAESQRAYAWGDPWSSPASGYHYDVPVTVSGIPGVIEQISASNAASYALTKTGVVWAWGAGQFGALGNGTTPAYSARAVRVTFPRGVTIKTLASPMPYDAGLAIDTHGNVWGWGSNFKSPLCAISGNVLVPRKLPLTDVTEASGAGLHALFYAGGKLYGCGGNASGELGNGTTTTASEPTLVVGLPHLAIRAVVSSWEGSGALMANGDYYDWGFNAADQLGNGTTSNSAVPVRVALPGPVRQVFMGGSDRSNGQTVAILDNDTTWSWGSDQYGQLGIGKVAPSGAPAEVDLPKGVKFSLVNSGGSTSYAIDSTGKFWSWGQNNFGQLGLEFKASSDVPVRVGIELTAVSSTAANVEGLWRADQGQKHRHHRSRTTSQ